MQKTMTMLTELKLVGITTRTNNVQIFAGDPLTNKIVATIMKYFHSGLAAKIKARRNPGTTFCVYINYASYVNGNYKYFIGKKVTSF